MSQAYFNGQWTDDRLLAVPVTDLGFTLGVTVTERLRTFGGRVFRQAEHVQRMQRSLEIVGLDPGIAAEIDSAISDFMQRNQSHVKPGEDWAIAAWATPGSGAEPTRCVHGFPLPFKQWADQYEQGVRLMVSQHRQTPPSCWPAELKCRSRMHYYLADQEAAAQQAGTKALLLDQQGYVGEGSTANVVIYTQAEGIVSPQRDKVLPGVSLAVLQELATQLAIPFTERDLSPQELRGAEEVMLTSTSICLLPVVQCDGHLIGAGRPGPTFRKLLSAWSSMVGLDIAQQAIAHA